MRPAGPYINEVKITTDLYIDHIAVPEPGVRYRLRRIDEPEFFADVDYVTRRGNLLYARTSELKEYPITGEGACVLFPFATRLTTDSQPIAPLSNRVGVFSLKRT